MLAVIGGSGRLPDELTNGRADTLCFAPEGVTFGDGANRAETFRIEQLGAFINRLKKLGVSELVFAGALRRPRLDPALLDAFTAGAMQSIGPALRNGDDALLRAVIALFEGAGFHVVSTPEVAPHLLPPAGVLTRRDPTEGQRADAERGLAILEVLAPLDVGQACVVSEGQALAIETLGGTDWMLGTLAGDVPWRNGGPGGVLCKAPKAHQDRRIDLPTIGPKTVEMAHAAGLAGVAIEAGGVIALDLDKVIAAADAAGMFLWVREP